MRASSPRLGLLLALALAAPSCSEPVTQLVVVVRSDLGLDALRVTVGASDAAAPGTPREIPGPLPLSFGVLPPGGDPAARARIRIEGLVGGQAVVQTVRIAPFVADQTSQLQVFLAAACRNPDCLLGQTCDRGKCRSESVDPSELTPVAPGEELPAPGDPDLVTAPTRVDFGALPANPNRPEVYVGQVVTASVSLLNAGAAKVVGLAARLTGDGAAHFTAGEVPSELEAGGKAQVRLQYSPSAPGPHAATLVLAAGGVEVRVELVGLAAECPGAQAVADPDGTCRLACEPGFADADADPDNGCECQIQGAEDPPDPSFVDSNCDGVDGEREAAVFLAPPPFGADGNPGTALAPVATFARATTLTSGDKPNIFVSIGAYPAPAQIPNGVSVYGGYDAASGWARGEAARPVIEAPGAAVTFSPGRTPRTFARMRVIARTALTAGVTSVALSAEDVEFLTVRDAVLEVAPGPPGADGARGDRGLDGEAGTPGADGDMGGAGGAGGAGGNSACNAPGGAGGDGAFDDQPGPLGEAVPGAAGGAGGIPFDMCTRCDPFCLGFEDWSEFGGDGGLGAAGVPGTDAAAAADATPTVVDGLVITPAGLSGGLATAGGGGGGGGGGAGGPQFCLLDDGRCFEASGFCDPDRGGGGGGGGGGGCPGAPGTGGEGGGSSIGVAAADSSVTLVDVSITTSDGGPGGAGGEGGAGGAGGEGAIWGLGDDDSTDGGAGGPGGPGGDGGDGSGGAGGASLCLLIVDGATVEQEGLTCSHGAGGPGGVGAGDGAAGPAGLAGERN